MGELVHPEAAAGAAGALRVVEHEELGADVAVDEVMRRAAQALVEPLGLGLRGALHDLRLQQAVAHQQRARDARADRLLVLPADDDAIDDRVHVLDVRRLQLGLVGDVDGLAVDDQTAAPLLAELGEDEVQVLAVDLEDRRAQLDLGALGKREDRFEDLARRSGSASARRCADSAPGRSSRTADSGSWRCPSACRPSIAGCCRPSSARSK